MRSGILIPRRHNVLHASINLFSAGNRSKNNVSPTINQCLLPRQIYISIPLIIMITGFNIILSIQHLTWISLTLKTFTFFRPCMNLIGWMLFLSQSKRSEVIATGSTDELFPDQSSHRDNL